MARITTTYKGETMFEIKMGNHTLACDVPDNMGGQDRAAVPPQIFVASLGSCIAAMVANYLDKAGVDTTDMTVDVDFDKVPDPNRLTNFKFTVNIPNGDISGREKAIERVVEFCPVHASIVNWEGYELEIKGK